MDSQHRHELQENELAAWLEEAIEKLRPHASLIVIGLVGLVLIYTAWGYYAKSARADKASEWGLYTISMLERSPDLGALQTASTELESGPVAQWADITWADGKLYYASTMWIADRDRATTELADAKDQYEQLLLTRGVRSDIRNRAQFGLARAYELEGEADKAVEAYQKVTGAFQDIAAERAEDLGKESTKEALDWLKTAKAPAFSLPAGGGATGALPDFSPDSLDDSIEAAPEDNATGDESLDDILKSYEKNSEEAAATEEPAAEEPAADEESEE